MHHVLPSCLRDCERGDESYSTEHILTETLVDPEDDRSFIRTGVREFFIRDKAWSMDLLPYHADVLEAASSIDRRHDLNTLLRFLRLDHYCQVICKHFRCLKPMR